MILHEPLLLYLVLVKIFKKPLKAIETDNT